MEITSRSNSTRRRQSSGALRDLLHVDTFGNLRVDRGRGLTQSPPRRRGSSCRSRPRRRSTAADPSTSGRALRCPGLFSTYIVLTSDLDSTHYEYVSGQMIDI